MSPPLKLGIFTNSYPGLGGTGGIPTYSRALASGLVDLGHEVRVLTFASDEIPDGSLVLEGVHIHPVRAGYLPLVERIAPGGWQSLRVSLAARQLTARYGLDAFEFPNWEGMGGAYKVAGRARAMVVRLHTSLLEIVEIENTPLDRKTAFSAWLERRTCLAADAMYVSTRAHRAFMARELGVPESRFAIVPLGIPDLPSPARAPRPRNRDPVVLYLGRLETRKGTADLLEATRPILAAVPNARLVLIGRDRPHAPGGVKHETWFRATFPPEIVRQVQFLGVQDDAEVAKWFERADLFVAPSHYESFGLIFVEAMRAAVPVVGTRAGGIPEVVTHGRSGLLVEPRAPAQLAEAVVAVLRDENLRLELARGARAEFESRFTHRVMAARTVDFHLEVLGRGRRARLSERDPAGT